MGEIVSRSVPPVTLFGFTLTGNSVVADDGIPYDQWEALGDWLKHCEGAVHWWIGDWLNYGERNYGHTYTQAMEATGFAYGTVANDKYVAGQIEPSRRRENVPFSHHQEVASIKDQKKQDELLGRAEKEEWTRETIREKVNEVCGIPRPVLTALDNLRAAWRAATHAEKRTFFTEIRHFNPD